MTSAPTYLFKSDRLGFRTWSEHDIVQLTIINADEKVMHYFPDTETAHQTRRFVERMQVHYQEKGYCYFPVDRLDTNQFIGFIGISTQTWPSAYSSFIDIGWRLSAQQWQLGFASEGAKRCLDYAFTDLHINQIHAIAPKINNPSIAVMKKIGMTFLEEFDHPFLTEHPQIQKCVRYTTSNDLMI